MGCLQPPSGAFYSYPKRPRAGFGNIFRLLWPCQAMTGRKLGSYSLGIDRQSPVHFSVLSCLLLSRWFSSGPECVLISSYPGPSFGCIPNPVWIAEPSASIRSVQLLIQTPGASHSAPLSRLLVHAFAMTKTQFGFHLVLAKKLYHEISPALNLDWGLSCPLSF